MLYINNKQVNLPSDKSFVGTDGHVLLDLKAKEFLLGESKKKGRRSRFYERICTRNIRGPAKIYC